MNDFDATTKDEGAINDLTPALDAYRSAIQGAARAYRDFLLSRDILDRAIFSWKQTPESRGGFEELQRRREDIRAGIGTLYVLLGFLDAGEREQ